VKFRSKSHVAADATKAALTNVLRSGAAVLFSASHGVTYESGDEAQEEGQGALVCQEAPAPDATVGALDRAWYFAARDVPDDARIHGLVVLCYACFSAGTSTRDDVDGSPLAEDPFVARLPQRLLSHPAGGALAVLGHVNSAWGFSFQPIDAPIDAPALGPQIQAYRDTLGYVMQGRTVGFAARGFSERAASLAAELAVDTDPVRSDAQPAAATLAPRWAERNDAQNFVILGDPAVRLRVDRLT
jgi:hypothetical protein